MSAFFKKVFLHTVLILGLSSFSYVFAIPLVSIEPSTQIVNVGQSFTLDVKVSDVVDLYGFQFDLIFSPSILASTGMAEGGFLATGGATFFIPGLIDNLTGTISFIANTLLGPDPGVNGTGILASFDFVATGSGTSPVTLSNVLLLDSTLAEIPSTTANATVKSFQPTEVAEPATMLFFGLGLIGVIGLKKKS
jgi:hypothetical protein